MAEQKPLCLMLGAGFSSPVRRIMAPGAPTDIEWRTLDINPMCAPDKVFDLRQLEKGISLPFPYGIFDEIHAYEILEHFGRQGDYQGLFTTFSMLWKALRPGGLLMGTCPSLASPWLFAEPGHTRVIAEGTLVFLTKDHYDQLGRTPCSDYRTFVDPFWWTLEHSEVDGHSYAFVLRKAE